MYIKINKTFIGIFTYHFCKISIYDATHCCTTVKLCYRDEPPKFASCDWSLVKAAFLKISCSGSRQMKYTISCADARNNAVIIRNTFWNLLFLNIFLYTGPISNFSSSFFFSFFYFFYLNLFFLFLELKQKIYKRSGGSEDSKI